MTVYGPGLLGSSNADRRLAWLGIVGWLGLWLLVSQTQLVDPLLLPSPFRVIEAAADIGAGPLALHFLATFARVVVGLLLGVLIGGGIGLAMQYSHLLFGILDGLVETFRPVPPVALVPFFILIFGFSELGKITVATLGVSLVVVVSTIEAIERVPIGVLRWGMVCALPRVALFARVILPAAWPDMRAGLRIALATAVTLVIVSEFMGATYGLGYLISVAKVTLSTHTLLLAATLLGWLGWFLDRILRALFDYTTRWDVRAKGALR